MAAAAGGEIFMVGFGGGLPTSGELERLMMVRPGFSAILRSASPSEAAVPKTSSAKVCRNVTYIPRYTSLNLASSDIDLIYLSNRFDNRTDMHRLPRAIRLRQPRNPHSSLALLGARRKLSHTSHPFLPHTFYRPTGEPVRYQIVRFQKAPLWTWRRLLTFTLYAGAVYGYLYFVGKRLDVEVEILDDSSDDTEDNRRGKGREERRLEDDNDDDEYASESSTFIPLTWATKQPRTFYKGSDPEWQTFVSIARDKPRHAAIQSELVRMVYTGALQHAGIARQLGEDAQVGKYWLDISFPDGPPPEYVRSGLEIGDGYVAWSSQRVSAEQHWRTARALWPTAALGGVWATVRVLAGMQWRRTKEALGWGEEEASFGGRSGVGGGVGGSSAAQQMDSAAAVVSSASSPQQQTTNGKKLPWPTVPLPTPHTPTDLPIALHVFSHTLSKAWQPAKMEPPRGTFIVQGLVEVRGHRGRILFDVQSCYDPRGTGRFIVVNASVRGFKKWRQAPKGGP